MLRVLQDVTPCEKEQKERSGPGRDLNPAVDVVSNLTVMALEDNSLTACHIQAEQLCGQEPEATIIPLDHQARNSQRRYGADSARYWQEII